MRTANPALNKNTFTELESSDNVMTLGGTANKSTLLLCILLATATYTWGLGADGRMLMMLGIFGGFITAIITIFKKTASPITAPIYAAFEGLFLGGISSVFEVMYPGIVSQAVFLTLGIFLALLFAYKSRIIKPTENFKLGVFAATAGIAAVYIINLFLSFFGSSIPVLQIDNASPLSIGISIFVIIIAALNLVLDFDFIESGVESHAPKYMEWYSAFGLLVTLVWLYIEILRLLAKLNSRR
ncbi:Bax inhibitor-1/YccA family protein [Methanolobus sp.]|uniref:Bax inhibitor-1/YccA family protein n=1 Tax=Methanolobus sp. TaxID=1874737 RepID=UPI0025F96809|nr:Bax inhibitor-1/YccA family protein [Methanolobus sp.]